MGKCEACGNIHARTFEVVMEGKNHVFDSFQCAIHMLATCCAHCGCGILGHGLEDGGEIFCGTYCAYRHRADEITEPG
jgi:hypothetical protein